jgi:hypothetical protein
MRDMDNLRNLRMALSCLCCQFSLGLKLLQWDGMKKNRLLLKKETVRELSPSEMGDAAGGTLAFLLYSSDRALSGRIPSSAPPPPIHEGFQYFKY